MELLVLVGVALSLGLISVVQSVTNGVAAGRIGLWTTLVINASVVFAGALLLWTVNRGWASTGSGRAPWYLLLGGVYGLCFLAGAAFVFPRLGAGPSTALMVAAQLTVALLFDHWGLSPVRLPVTPMRLLGAVLLFLGALLVLWPKLKS